ncbi:MAG: HAD-IIB family hydrolase [Erysipelotrichaceae bacterium]|nr:HAD-IIB family hydrolase [Erysipelotrichaceae bacterium]
MKLLIADLDGTLYPKKDVKNPNQLESNVEAVKRWIAEGNKFAVATARGLHHYPVLRKTLGFDVNFIGGNGAAVRLETGEEVIKIVPYSIFIDLCKFVLENKINASVATGVHNKWVWSSKDCFPIGLNIFRPGVEETIEVADLDAIDPTEGTDRIQIFVPEADLNNLRSQIEARNYPVSITTSDTYMIDIGPQNSSKGITIMELRDRFGVSPDDIIAVGDSENDIPMFEVVRRSYCIDHASPKVKEHSDFAVESVEKVIELELNRQ